MSVHSRLLALSALWSLVVLLAACGAGSGATSSDTTSSLTATTSSPTPTVTPVPTRLGQAVDTCSLANSTGADLGDANHTLTLDTKGKEDRTGLSIADVACVLLELKATQAVIAHIDQTRALDGMQADSWSEFNARWTYHPDAGLEIILTEQ